MSLPTLDDILSRLQDADTFVILDLNQAYLQLRLDEVEDTRKLLVVNTLWEVFEYLRLPFGLSSSPFTFQKFMDSTLAEFPFAQAFPDDVIICGKGVQECYQNKCVILDNLHY